MNTNKRTSKSNDLLNIKTIEKRNQYEYQSDVDILNNNTNKKEIRTSSSSGHTLEWEREREKRDDKEERGHIDVLSFNLKGLRNWQFGVNILWWLIFFSLEIFKTIKSIQLIPMHFEI